MVEGGEGEGLTKRTVGCLGTWPSCCSFRCDLDRSWSAFRRVVLLARWSRGDAIGLCEEKNPGDDMFALLVLGRFGSGSRNMKKKQVLRQAEETKGGKDRRAYQTKDRPRAELCAAEGSRGGCE